MLYGFSEVIIKGTLVTLELAISSVIFAAGDWAYRGGWEVVQKSARYVWFL